MAPVIQRYRVHRWHRKRSWRFAAPGGREAAAKSLFYRNDLAGWLAIRHLTLSWHQCPPGGAQLITERDCVPLAVMYWNRRPGARLGGGMATQAPSEQGCLSCVERSEAVVVAALTAGRPRRLLTQAGTKNSTVVFRRTLHRSRQVPGSRRTCVPYDAPSAVNLQRAVSRVAQARMHLLTCAVPVGGSADGTAKWQVWPQGYCAELATYRRKLGSCSSGLGRRSGSMAHRDARSVVRGRATWAG